MSEWISIPENLLAEAGKALAPPNPTDQETDVPRALLEAIVGYLSEDLGCDHSVGICMCGIAGLVEELQLVLGGRKRCQKCGGEGYVFDQALYDEAVEKAAEAFKFPPERARYYVSDFDGMANCLGCDGTGSVPTDQLEGSK